MGVIRRYIMELQDNTKDFKRCALDNCNGFVMCYGNFCLDHVQRPEPQ